MSEKVLPCPHRGAEEAQHMIRTRGLTRTFGRGHGKGASTVEAVA